MRRRARTTLAALGGLAGHGASRARDLRIVPLKGVGEDGMHPSTINRWRALEPSARRKLTGFLAKQLVICAALYAVAALLDHSWWRPAVAIVAIGVATDLVRRIDRRYEVSARFRRRR